jgi:hypothetical protein
MRTSAILVLLLGLATSVSAAVIHDESVNGDLSSNAAAPTALAFPVGSSTILGTINGNPLDRDYITFTIGVGQTLTSINLVSFGPDQLAFSAINAGATSFIPSGATIGSFLAGIHFSAFDVGSNFLVLFVTSSVTTNSLPAPVLGPGTYCFMVQQTSAVLQSYNLEFVVTSPVPTENTTWGGIKALYR